MSIIFSLTNGGAQIETLLDHGNASNGSSSTAIEVFIRHDYSNPITNVGLYLRQVSSTYSGSFTSAADLAEILSWGDGADANAFGGLQCNFDAVGSYPEGSYPEGSWPTYSTPAPTNGAVFKTGTGDTEDNAITLPVATGAVSAGTIQAGSSPNVRFKVQTSVPADEDTVGIRQFEWVVRYNFTS